MAKKSNEKDLEEVPITEEDLALTGVLDDEQLKNLLNLLLG